MDKPYDRITEAYYDKMGQEFGKKVRDRIHWICTQAKGENILDVSCSQGIVSMLLARENKKVLGIDIIEESIEYAKKALESEHEITKSNVRFEAINFMDFDFVDNKYDSVIMAEILEHLSEPSRFLEKAMGLIKDEGRIIITVPFGINDYIDHKRTYYLTELIREVENFFSIKDVCFFGKWIGVVGEKKGINYKSVVYDETLLKQLEENFHFVERSLVDENISKANTIKTLKEGIQKTQQDLGDKKSESLGDLTNESDSKDNIINQLKKENKKLEEENGILKKDLIKHIEEEERILIEHKEYIIKYNELQQNYDLFKNSKLGRFTLRYWEYKWRIKKKIKKLIGK